MTSSAPRRGGRRRGPMVGTVLGFAAVVTAGAVLLGLGDRPVGVLLVVLGSLLLVLSLVLVGLSRMLREPSRGGQPTGRVVPRAPVGRPVWSAGRPSWTWTGGGNVPIGSRRVNVTTPLAVLELTGTDLTLRIRPRVMRAALGAAPLRWSATETGRCYPVRNRWTGFSRGLGIEGPQGLCYFWTGSPEPVLAALEQQGFPVDWAERFVAVLLVSWER